MKEPEIHVGILSEVQIEFTFSEPYRVIHERVSEKANYEEVPGSVNGEEVPGSVNNERVSEGVNNKEVTGKQSVLFDNGKILWQNNRYDELLFEPLQEETGSFELSDVTIGVHFHWERKENQRFHGALKFIVEDEKITAINIIRIEDYLTSVISSEMSATASPELLKAHAVISRSWLLYQLEAKKEKSKQLKAENEKPGQSNAETGEPEQVKTERIKWYDREDHAHFDVCADDHCQRYQGITRATTENVAQAVQATRGQVLTSDNKICDARFSKCCGGALEEFQYCWEDIRHPYLVGRRDSKKTTFLPDLRIHSEAEKWIRNYPEAFCHTQEKRILSQVLNNYDQETTDFYRWKVEYTQEELAGLIFQRSGIDYGQIIDLIPIERGTSARISKLKIIGTKETFIIGKELEIRRTLSPSHLYSSAFVVDKAGIKDGIPGKFILTGAGWGHGVGLCQIGAAVMGEQGYTYNEILLHYYTGAAIEKLY